jgi:hypothetical protein
VNGEMSSKELLEIIERTEMLTPEERLRLLAHLMEKVRQGEGTQGRRWSEICGAAAFPLVGEDAQNWVSHARQASDESRARQWGEAL